MAIAETTANENVKALRRSVCCKEALGREDRKLITAKAQVIRRVSTSRLDHRQLAGMRLSDVWGPAKMPPAPKDFGPHFDFPPAPLNSVPLPDPFH